MDPSSGVAAAILNSGWADTLGVHWGASGGRFFSKSAAIRLDVDVWLSAMLLKRFVVLRRHAGGSILVLVVWNSLCK